MTHIIDVIWRYMQLITYMDIIDVLLVTFLIYKLFSMVRDSSGSPVLRGIVLILLAAQASAWIGLHTLNYVLSTILQLGVIAIVIIFQPELRRILEDFGKNISTPFFLHPHASESEMLQLIKTLVSTASNLSRSRTGALIVIEQDTKLHDIIQTGTKLNAIASEELLCNIFYPGAPLHDGAVVISGTQLAAAACVLPLSANTTLNRSLGTRHRAGLGISENTDALSIIVSEETGTISFAANGMLKRNLTGEVLSGILTDILNKPIEQAATAAAKKIRKKKDTE